MGSASMVEQGDGRLRLATVGAVLLVVSTVSWRHGVYFSGAVDPVVAAKGVVGASAFVVALYGRRRWPAALSVGDRTLWLILAFASVAALGGIAAGGGLAAVVISARLALVAGTVAVFLRWLTIATFTRAMVYAMLGIGALAALTGLPTLASGRLEGGVPPLTHNELAMVFGAPALVILARVFRQTAGPLEPPLYFTALAVTWFTGSRTGLLALIVGSLLVVTQARRIPAAAMAVLVLCVPVALYIVTRTSVLASFFERGGTENVGTLSSRTIAWSAALDYPQTLWQSILGSGLNVKQIPVRGQYWNEQILDSSWVSALVQAGWLGVAIEAIAVVAAVVAVLRCPRPIRMGASGVLAFVLIRSVLESGMLDASVFMIAFFSAATIVERATWAGRRDEWAVDHPSQAPTHRTPAFRPARAATFSGSGRAATATLARAAAVRSPVSSVIGEPSKRTEPSS